MSEHEQAAEALRAMADALERDEQTSLNGELRLQRERPVSREEIDRWVERPYYASPIDQDRTQTTILRFALSPELPEKASEGRP